MSAGASVRASTRRIPFTEIDNFSALFRDYCTNYEALSGFFAGDYRRAEVRAEAVERTLGFERDRESLAGVLLDQNTRWGLSDETRRHIEALRRPDSAAVVTGQQVGIFGGPLFTILKALSTIQLADQLSDETGRPVVPVFWLGAEDHDFDEISRVTLLRRNEPVELRYEPPRAAANGNLGPVGRIRMNDTIDRLVDRLDEILPPTDFKDDVMSRARRSYRSGATFSDAFALLLRSMFEETGLVIMNSDDSRLKRLVAPLYKKEVAEADSVADRIREVSSRLGSAYHEQVQIRPVNLFLLNERGRYPLDLEDGAFTVRGRGETYTRAELEDLLDRAPERFSPNVVLRPLTQDRLLPTAMYVAGPSEVAYFAQYRSVYEWAGLPMPLIYPRASVTIIESKVAKVLEKYGLTVGDFGDDLDRLFQRVVVETMEIDVDAVFDAAGSLLHDAVDRIKPPLRAIDATLTKATEATRQALVEEFEKLKAKAVRLEKKNQDVVRAQLEKAHVNLYPGGTLQERTLSILYFLNKYGIGLLKELREAVSTDTTAHQVVEL